MRKVRWSDIGQKVQSCLIFFLYFSRVFTNIICNIAFVGRSYSATIGVSDENMDMAE